MSTKHASVFAIHNVAPEVLAYAMAKYSRSSLSMKESIEEISSQKASDFLNTFYFQYGHRSIADMAHVPMALENISLLAAIEVADEQRWDGQERSTRYQDFSKREYYTPKSDFTEDEAEMFSVAIEDLFTGYDNLFTAAQNYFQKTYYRPEDMDRKAYERTVRARAFDVARSLLPLATLTSVGQVVSARTLEGQISRLMASEHPEIVALGDKMKTAATSYSYNVKEKAVAQAFSEYYKANPDWNKPERAVETLSDIYNLTGLSPALAPTLVKHTEPDTYRTRIREIAQREFVDIELDVRPGETDILVHTSVPETEDPTIEIVATILYEHSHYTYHRLQQWVSAWGKPSREMFLEKVLQARGRHDELPRAFRTGGYIFDIHMDIGGFRDLHRHRRAQQFFQDYTFSDYEPVEGVDIWARTAYVEAINRARYNYTQFRSYRRRHGKSTAEAAYLLPLGAKRRFLMKMDLAEAAYIAELRTQPAGHISYRRVAWEMYRALTAIAPALAAGIADRVTDPGTPLDFFKR